MKKQSRRIRKKCIQCNVVFYLHPSDLEDDAFDWRFCSEGCEKISKDLDAAEIRREEGR